MPIISPASIQNLKSRIDIVEVVSAVVALKRAGSSYKGLSPFNTEKTPSFFVSPDKGLFKCFSSGKAGDVITFVRETEQLSFTEAVEALAKRFNIPLEYAGGGPSREERSLRQQLFDLHEEAAQHFHEAFLADSDAGRFIRAYWTEQRRFEPAVAEDFKIGFAAPDGGGLLERLRRRGYTPAALAQSGLFYARDGHLVGPRFRGRLMIPIRDHQGRVVAFTARQLAVTPADDPTREAKYVNSPETPIFVKSQVLFNLDRARKPAAEGQAFLMVEGQLDAIRCWCAGLTTAVAPQGTSVTELQLRLLHRYQHSLEVLLDGDDAGQRAALRVLPLALQEGLEISFLPLAGTKDPDELVREQGAAALEELRGRRLSAMAFAARLLAPNPAALSAQQLADVARELFAIIAHSPSAVAQSEYLAEAATLLRVSRGALESDFRRFQETAARRAPSPAAGPRLPGTGWPPASATDRSLTSPGRHAAVAVATAPDREPAPDAPLSAAPSRPALITVEYDLLLLVLQYEGLGRVLAETIHHEWIDTTTREGRLLDQILHAIAHDVWPGTAARDEFITDPDDRNFLASLLFAPAEIEDPVKVANEGIRRMIRNFCTPRIRKIELEIAAKQGNVDADLLSFRQTLTELRHLRTHPPTIHVPA